MNPETLTRILEKIRQKNEALYRHLMALIRYAADSLGV